MIKISDIQFLKKIASGMYGTTYLVKRVNKPDRKLYVCKVEHVLPADIKLNLKHNLAREIKFSKEVCEKYPDQFCQLLSYTVVKDCPHIQEYAYDPKDFDKKQQDEFKALAKSRYSIIRLYPYKGDITVENIIYKLSIDCIYSMVIQLLYILNIMESHGYKHVDSHTGNFCVTKTSKKFINILGYKVPTYGYLYSVIDYGRLLGNKFVLNKEEKKIMNNGVKDISFIFEVFLLDYNFRNYIRDKKLHINATAASKKREKTKEYRIITHNITYNPYIAEILFAMLYPELDQHILLGKNTPKKVFMPEYLISLTDIIYMAHNLDNLPMIIVYFLDKCK